MLVPGGNSAEIANPEASLPAGKIENGSDPAIIPPAMMATSATLAMPMPVNRPFQPFLHG